MSKANRTKRRNTAYQPPPKSVATFDLDPPLDAFGGLDQIEARAIRFGDIVDTDGLGDMAKVAALISKTTNLPPRDVRDLSLKDVAQISNWIGEQMESFDEVGEVIDEDEDEPHP
jgi:adenine-specific DNA methylase